MNFRACGLEERSYVVLPMVLLSLVRAMLSRRPNCTGASCWLPARSQLRLKGDAIWRIYLTTLTVTADLPEEIPMPDVKKIWVGAIFGGPKVLSVGQLSGMRRKLQTMSLSGLLVDSHGAVMSNSMKTLILLSTLIKKTLFGLQVMNRLGVSKHQ